MHWQHRSSPSSRFTSRRIAWKWPHRLTRQNRWRTDAALCVSTSMEGETRQPQFRSCLLVGPNRWELRRFATGHGALNASRDMNWKHYPNADDALPIAKNAKSSVLESEVLFAGAFNSPFTIKFCAIIGSETVVKEVWIFKSCLKERSEINHRRTCQRIL